MAEQKFHTLKLPIPRPILNETTLLNTINTTSPSLIQFQSIRKLLSSEGDAVNLASQFEINYGQSNIYYEKWVKLETIKDIIWFTWVNLPSQQTDSDSLVQVEMKHPMFETAMSLHRLAVTFWNKGQDYKTSNDFINACKWCKNSTQVYQYLLSSVLTEEKWPGFSSLKNPVLELQPLYVLGLRAMSTAECYSFMWKIQKKQESSYKEKLQSTPLNQQKEVHQEYYFQLRDLAKGSSEHYRHAYELWKDLPIENNLLLSFVYQKYITLLVHAIDNYANCLILTEDPATANSILGMAMIKLEDLATDRVSLLTNSLVERLKEQIQQQVDNISEGIHRIINRDTLTSNKPGWPVLIYSKYEEQKHIQHSPALNLDREKILSSGAAELL